MPAYEYDAVVVGSGPNGLAAAITLAQAGCRVLVIEGASTVGGGMRTAELTLPGFRHDVCSAIHSLGVTSPFFRSLPLADYGLEWIFPPISVGHPLEGGEAVLVWPSVEKTAASLGEDANTYMRLFQPLVDNFDKLMSDILAPIRIPRHPLLMARFGMAGLQPAAGFTRRSFRSASTRTAFAGMAAHSMLDLNQPVSTAFGLTLAMTALKAGWPMARGGSQFIADALAMYLTSLGGEICTGHYVSTLEELPSARAYLMDVTPRQLVEIAGDRLPSAYKRQATRFRYGPGVCKLDWALDGPIPWQATELSQTAVVHVGATLEEIVQSERQVWHGEHPSRPYVIVVQQSLFDPSRAPAGKHTAWAYCHVPHGSNTNMRAQIEAQIERFAPGFRQRILAAHVYTAAEMEAYNPNYIGGDINSGVQDFGQFITRPVPRWNPYSTPVEGLYLCSSATPPGGGVHGMCGYHAAQTALKRI